MKFLVLGGGIQGSAAAYDLLQRDDVERVVVADLNAKDPGGRLLAPYRESDRLELRRMDASSEADALSAMKGMTGVLCALPYHFNYAMARLAVASGTHFTDLGGNTKIVSRQRSLHADACAKGLSVVPDTGLAPGLVNILAEAGIQEMDAADSVRIWVGGLPQNPKPPLNYQLVYSLKGMLDYYVTPAEVLKDGRKCTVEALTGVETLSFPEPVGTLEAFYTGGGISSMPDRYEGRITTMEYKTLRYPGHARIMRAVRDLGLLAEHAVEYNGSRVVPREFFIHQVTPFLANDQGDDFVTARVQVTGTKDGAAHEAAWNVHDLHDPATGITAMARTTGFSLAVTALIQARGQATVPGVGTPDEAVPFATYVAALRRRGIQIKRLEDRR